MESSCVYGAHAVSTAHAPLQTSCRPQVGCGSLGRSEASEWRFAANSPSIAKRNPKEGPLERNEEVYAHQSLLGPFNQVLHKLVWVVHMMANGSPASCRPNAGGLKRRGAAQLSADRPSPTMTSALGHRLATCSEVCGPCVKEGSNLWHSADTSGITRVMPPENKGLALTFARTIRVCRGSRDQIEKLIPKRTFLARCLFDAGA